MTELVAPVEQAHIVEAIRDAYAAESAVYPIGGGTTRNFGMPAKRSGNELSLAGLDRVLDYPSRDMTITVEAGITMQKLAEVLAAEGQRLPVDVAEDERATLGGVIATNFSGPRRYGCGTIRDYVIGTSAVDGRGTLFKAGGRVVKNVAGYDFCKLLTGSLGTLAVITQATLKLKPIPEADAFVACHPASAAEAERLLAALNDSATRPSAVELLVGWSAFDENKSPDSAELLVGLEGTRKEVSWSVDTLSAEWDRLGVGNIHVISPIHRTSQIWRSLSDFGASAVDATLVVKCGVRPGAMCAFIETIKQVVPASRIESRAGSGTMIVVIDELPPEGAAKLMIQHLRPAAQAAGGHAIVWSSSSDDLTRQATWGPSPPGFAAMQSVKQQFDPKNLLNPGRYFFA